MISHSKQIANRRINDCSTRLRSRGELVSSTRPSRHHFLALLNRCPSRHHFLALLNRCLSRHHFLVTYIGVPRDTIFSLGPNPREIVPRRERNSLPKRNDSIPDSRFDFRTRDPNASRSYPESRVNQCANPLVYRTKCTRTILSPLPLACSPVDSGHTKFRNVHVLDNEQRRNKHTRRRGNNARITHGEYSALDKSLDSEHVRQ